MIKLKKFSDKKDHYLVIGTTPGSGAFEKDPDSTFIHAVPFDDINNIEVGATGNFDDKVKEYIWSHKDDFGGYEDAWKDQVCGPNDFDEIGKEIKFIYKECNGNYEPIKELIKKKLIG